MPYSQAFIEQTFSTNVALQQSPLLGVLSMVRVANVIAIPRDIHPRFIPRGVFGQLVSGVSVTNRFERHQVCFALLALRLSVHHVLRVAAVSAGWMVRTAQIDLEFWVISGAVFVASIDQHNELAVVNGQRCIVAGQQSFQVGAQAALPVLCSVCHLHPQLFILPLLCIHVANESRYFSQRKSRVAPAFCDER
jgi:hypothetical protein